jgi:chemotaxis-related protein WspD
MSDSILSTRSSLSGTPAQVPPNGAGAAIIPCWNEIGIHGNGSCPELPKYVRCQNCPVYSNAGVRLLDRPLPPEYRRDWNEHLARQERRVGPRLQSALVFRIHDEWLALPTEAFQEAAERRRIHSLPHRQHGIVLGLVNIRGELLICVSLGRLLGLEDSPPRQIPRHVHPRLLVGDWGGNRFVFPVDEVRGIHRFDPQHLQEPPATLARSNQTFTRGTLNWEQRTVGFLDPNLLFSALNRSLV